MAVAHVREKDLDQIHMKKADGGDGERDVAHLQEGNVSIDVQPYRSCVQYDGPGNYQSSVQFSEAVPVDEVAPIASFRIDVPRHCRDVFSMAMGFPCV